MGNRGPKPRRKEIVWSPDFAYALGLIASDGCLGKDGLHLTFVSKDIEQIQTLKRCLELMVKERQYSSGRIEAAVPYYHIQWGDVTLHTYLNSIGITANKSLTMGALDIPDLYFFDFLRGSFDGDGCFYSYFDPRWRNSFMFYVTFTSASLAHIRWIQEKVFNHLNVKGHISSSQPKEKRKAFHQLRYAKKEGFELLRMMYPTSQTTCLKRKRLKIEEALGIVGLSLP